MTKLGVFKITSFFQKKIFKSPRRGDAGCATMASSSFPLSFQFSILFYFGFLTLFPHLNSFLSLPFFYLLYIYLHCSNLYHIYTFVQFLFFLKIPLLLFIHKLTSFLYSFLKSFYYFYTLYLIILLSLYYH